MLDGSQVAAAAAKLSELCLLTRLDLYPPDTLTSAAVQFPHVSFSCMAKHALALCQARGKAQGLGFLVSCLQVSEHVLAACPGGGCLGRRVYVGGDAGKIAAALEAARNLRLH